MAKTKKITIEPLKETTMLISLVGDTDLILSSRNRLYVQSEVWRQSHDKGSDLPDIFKQSKNIWENRITSIHWKNPIEYHDEDISLYTEDEWKRYMKENQPCLLGIGFRKSFKEAFVTFYKDSTGKNGTDFTRALCMGDTIFPITFSSVRIEDTLVPTNEMCTTSVIQTQNVFSGWKCDILISCVDIVFPPETILSVVNTTGKYIGIGSQRKNGMGRYHIENVKMV